MNHRTLRLAAGLICCWLSATAHGAVVITPLPEQAGYRVTTGVYMAVLDSAGALTSLVVTGEEFLAQDRKLRVDGKIVEVPALFASHQRAWAPTFLLTGPVVVDGTNVKTQGEGWQLLYAFEESAIVVSFGGFPKGANYPLDQGYPNGGLDIWLSPKLHRAVDPMQQGDLGWPVTGNPEPGDYTVIAKNGAGVEFQNSFWIARFDEPKTDALPRGDFLLFGEMAKKPGPIVRKIVIHPQVDLGRSVELAISSPNPDHIFASDGPVTFPVTVASHYGKPFRGKLRFEGSNYVFKEKKVSAEMPVQTTPGAEPVALNFPMQPAEPGHYIGNLILNDGAKDLYQK